MGGFLAVMGREARLAWAGGGGAAAPAAFFLAALVLAPLAIGPESATLQAAGPGLVVFAAFLAVLQPAEKLFGEDLSDGTLELYGLSGESLSLLLGAKTLGWTLATLWPLPLLAGLGGVFFGLTPEATLALAAALAAAAPGLMFITAFAAALAAGLKRAGLLIALIAAPLQTPLLIFAAAAGRSAMEGDGRSGSLILLCLALSLALSVGGPLLTAAAARNRMD